MSDLFGYTAERAPFVDIRNQLESVAEEKARLCRELNDLLRRTPKPSAIATIQLVTGYKSAHKSALKVLQCKTSSRQELASAVTTMRGWHGETA